MRSGIHDRYPKKAAVKLVFVLGFAVVSGCFAARMLAESASAVSPLHGIVAAVRTQADEKRAMETMARVYSSDRWFTFPKFEDTARYLAQRLRDSGLREVEIGGATADGKTQAGYWTMPLAWDVKSARLEMIEPERALLCDYAAVPTSLGMWSGPTPTEGVTAELVDITRTPWSEVKGKLVLTDKNAAGFKHQLVKYGALGAVNGFSENPELRDGRQWVNAWGDEGWGFTKTSTPLVIFSVTPRQADHMRELLAAGKKVTLNAHADTRYYEGRYPWVTGVLPGTNPDEEVLVLGHTSEQGAQDNATGVAAMTESLNTIARLVDAGKLPRPRRTIRILLMPELYGSLSYISAHRERMEKTIAAITVDTPAASYALAGTEYTLYMNPHVAMSYLDALIARVAQEYFQGARPWHTQAHTPGTDSYLGDPTIGVPDVWLYSGTGVVTHHNSADTPDTVDPRSLDDLISITASYLYFNASAGEQQLPWIAGITAEYACRKMLESASKGNDALASGDANAAGYALDRVSYFADRGEQAVLSTLRLAASDKNARALLDPVLAHLRQFRDLELERLRTAGAKPVTPQTIPGADHIIVQRKRIGTLPLDDLPIDKREGYPSGAWDTLVTTALYWCDGKRNLAEAIHLTEMELGPSGFDFVGYFRFVEKHGYVEFAH